MMSRDFSNGQKNGRNLDSTDQQDSESLDLDQRTFSSIIVRKTKNYRLIWPNMNDSVIID
jgi:hypothetical protein